MLDTDKSGKITVAEFYFYFLVNFHSIFLGIKHCFVGVLSLRKSGKKCLRMLMKMGIKKFLYQNFRKLLKILVRNSRNNDFT